MLLLLMACGTEKLQRDRVEPTFITVTVGGEHGSAEAPLPFSSEPQSWDVRVETLGHDAELYPFAGTLTLTTRPGKIEGNPAIEVSNGVWEGTVQIKNGFGPTRIWASDEGEAGNDRTPSFATGVGEPLWYQLPTLAEMNAGDDHESNQLAGEFAEIRTVDRDVRVIAVGTAGYWVSDLADAQGSGNNLFVYTFGRPGDEVVVGARVTLLNGGNQEYLATTQLNFPSDEIGTDALVEIPAPSPLTTAQCEDHLVLEGYESGLVRLDGVMVPSSFKQGSEEWADYEEYGQWPVVFEDGDSCAFYVDATLTAPDFVPAAGVKLGYVQGILAEVYGKWIVLPRDTDDLGLIAGSPPSNGSPRLPLPPGQTFPDLRQSDPCLP